MIYIHIHKERERERICSPWYHGFTCSDPYPYPLKMLRCEDFCEETTRVTWRGETLLNSQPVRGWPAMLLKGYSDRVDSYFMLFQMPRWRFMTWLRSAAPYCNKKLDNERASLHICKLPGKVENHTFINSLYPLCKYVRLYIYIHLHHYTSISYKLCAPLYIYTSIDYNFDFSWFYIINNNVFFCAGRFVIQLFDMASGRWELVEPWLNGYLMAVYHRIP